MAVLDELGKTQKELVFFSKRDVLICIFSGLNRLSQWPRGLRRAACGRSPAEILGSNPTGGMDICLL